MEANWTEERIAELKRLFALGLSFSQIAADLGGVSRCGVTGKLHRLGLRRGKPRSSPRPRVKQESAPRRQSSIRIKPALPPHEELEDTLPTAVCVNRISLLDTNDSHCRWPAADDGSASMVCGNQTVDGHSWCLEHFWVAFIPREPHRAPRISPTLVPEVA